MATIQGREAMIDKSGGGWWYIFCETGGNIASYMRADGLWHSCEPTRFPTEAAAQAFIEQHADKPATAAAESDSGEIERLRTELAAARAERDKLASDYAEEVAEFNAGHDAAMTGQPESDEPSHTKYDVWAVGYCWAKYGRKCDATAAELTELRARAEKAEAERVTFANSVLAELQKADEERLQGTHDSQAEAEKWKAEGDMYGWNFHQGMASGMTQASIIFFRVKRFVEAALKGGAA